MKVGKTKCLILAPIFTSSRYQQCIEDANIDMTRDMIGHHDNHELAFETLCAGIDQVKLYYLANLVDKLLIKCLL